MSNARRKKKPIDKFFYRISLFKKKGKYTHIYNYYRFEEKTKHTDLTNTEKEI